MISSLRSAARLIRAGSPLALAALGLVLLTGCSTLSKPDPAVTGPFYVPPNVRTSAAGLPAELRRIAVLPSAADGPTLTEASLDELDSILRSALTPAARGEIAPVDRNVLGRLAHTRQLATTALLPSGFTEQIASLTGADALLFVDITSYSAYPPLALGVRARLMDAKTGEIYWAFDNRFSADDPAVINSVRRYHMKAPVPGAAETDLSVTSLQNPARFAAYVMAATCATLPAR